MSKSAVEVHEIDTALVNALPPDSLFAVGGRVRDQVRGEIENFTPAQKDLDYVVCGVHEEDLRKCLQKLGPVNFVGASFSIFKVTIAEHTVDVALPRRERSTGIGHRDFEVVSGPEIPLSDDLARRDFRMNMMARSLPGDELVDPYGGRDDLAAHRIDILSAHAFEEDPLRMLRAAQFAARFEYDVSPNLRAAMEASAPMVTSVSGERVAEELAKLCRDAARPSNGLELLRETGVLREIWPELLEGVGVEQNEWHAYDVYRHTLATVDATPPGDLVLRLAALFHDVGKPRTKEGPHFYRHEHVGHDLVREMLGRVRFSNGIIDRVAHLVCQHMYSADPYLSDAGIRRFIRRIGPANLEHQFALRAADAAGSGLPKREDGNAQFERRVWAEVQRKPAFSVRDLAVDGTAVMEALKARGAADAHYRGDRRVGDALEWLFEQVTEAPERNERTSLLALLNDYLDAAEKARA